MNELNVNTCCYCGTKVQTNEDYFYCEFCDMNIEKSMICQNGSRKKSEIKTSYLDVNYTKTTPELMTISTLELLELLKYAREFRSLCWDNYFSTKQTMQQIKKAKLETVVLNEAINLAQIAFKEYTNATKKMFVFENLICERLGYIPKRVSAKFMEKYIEMTNDKKDKKMTFSKFSV